MSVSAPYNFVPLSDAVFLPSEDILGAPSQDHPIDGGVSGTISFELSSNTPILVSGPGEEKRFMQPSGEPPTISGSSLRGMIRNVMEIASFGKMQFTDDQRVAVRDLQSTASLDYGSRMTGSADGGFAPRSFAGYLQLVDGTPRLVPCEFGRIDHDDLQDLVDQKHLSVALQKHNKADLHTLLAGLSDRDPRSDVTQTEARFVEEEFLNLGGNLEQGRLCVQTQRFAHQHSDNRRLVYRRVAPSKAGAERNSRVAAVEQSGRLVFTGMPSGKKHMEFFFFGERDELANQIPQDVWRNFLEAHEAQEKKSITWEWRKAAFNRGERIPVFWLGGLQGGRVQVKHLGLAMMFKLPADNSVHDMIGSEGPHLNEPKPDLATRLFGAVANTDKADDGSTVTTGFKTRVSFGWATLQTPKTEYDTPQFRTPMARPKPSFTPSYVRQKDEVIAGKLKTVGETRHGDPIYSQYRSYMDWTGGPDQIRGWKRYPARTPEARLPQVPEGADGNAVTLHPIVAKTGDLVFKGKIRFHNLHPAELGALMWVLGWGGNTDLVHSLGMGRAFGWGQVRFTKTDVTYAYDAPTGDPKQAFLDMMNVWAKKTFSGASWEDLQEIRQLKAMASPSIGNENRAMLRPLTLAVGVRNGNQFVNAKMAGDVLPDYPMWREGGSDAVPVQAASMTKKKGAGAVLAPPKEFSQLAPPPAVTDTNANFVGRTGYYHEPITIVAQKGQTVTVEYDDEPGEFDDVELSDPDLKLR